MACYLLYDERFIKLNAYVIYHHNLSQRGNSNG